MGGLSVWSSLRNDLQAIGAADDLGVFDVETTGDLLRQDGGRTGYFAAMLLHLL